jgi:hypothetical protein
VQANALQVFAAIKSLKTAGCMTAVLTISYQMNCEFGDKGLPEGLPALPNRRRTKRSVFLDLDLDLPLGPWD